MPSLKNSAIKLDPNRWRDVRSPLNGPAAHVAPPVLPANLQQNRIMISSLPPIATNVTVGSITQFYGGRAFPRRQVILN